MPVRFSEQSVEERLRRFTRRGSSGCLIWIGCRTPSGYGQATVGSRTDGTRRTVRAHRMAWEAVKGRIPEGLFVLHSCDNPSCVEVEHLFLGTARDNIHDAMRKGRLAVGERHGRTLLKESDVVEIRRLREAGETLASLGRRYGITKQAVQAIVLYRTWRGVR